MARGSFLTEWLRLAVFQGVGLAMSAGTIIVATVAIPPAIYGQYGILLSLVQITSAVGLLWLQSGLLRYGREEFRAKGTCGDTVLATLALAAMVVGAALALGLALGPWLFSRLGVPAEYLAAVAPCFAAFALFECMSYAAQVRGRMDGYAWGQIIARAGPLAAGLALLAGWPGGPGFLIGSAGAAWALAAAWTARAALVGGLGATRGWPTRIRPLVTYGRFIPISVAATMLSQWLGLWVVRAEIGLAAAGVYLLALGVFTIFSGFMQPLGAVLAPRMVDLRLTDNERAMRDRVDLVLASGVLLAISCPLALAAVRCAAGAMLPTAYAEAAILIAVLMAAFPALVVQSAISPLVAAYETTVPKIVALSVAGCALNIMLLIVLVPRLGTLGAAFATMLTGLGMSLVYLSLAAASGIAGIDWTVIRRQALVNLGLVVLGLGLAALSPLLVLFLGATISIAGLTAGRALGFTAPLAALRPLLAETVIGRLPLVRQAIDWLAGDPR